MRETFLLIKRVNGRFRVFVSTTPDGGAVFVEETTNISKAEFLERYEHILALCDRMNSAVKKEVVKKA